MEREYKDTVQNSGWHFIKKTEKSNPSNIREYAEYLYYDHLNDENNNYLFQFHELKDNEIDKMLTVYVDLLKDVPLNN